MQEFENKNLQIKKCYDNLDRCVVKDKSRFRYILEDTGLTDKQGNIIIPCIYASIAPLKDLDSYFVVRTKYSKLGLTDKNGKTIFAPGDFTNIEYLKGSDSSFVLHTIDTGDTIIDKNGRILLDSKEKYHIHWQLSGNYYQIQDCSLENFGLMNVNTGKIVIPVQYEHITKDDIGNYKIWKNDNAGIIDKDFNLILPAKYSFIMYLPGNKYYRVELEEEITNSEGLPETVNRYGITDLKGNFVVPLDCGYIDKAVSTYKVNVKRNGKNYIFNSKDGSIQLQPQG